MAALPLRKGLYGQFRKSARIACKLCASSIAGDLQKHCEKNSKEHQCQVPFRDNVGAVVRWRKLWYALPKADRCEKLKQWIAGQLQAYTALRHGDADGFRIAFSVLGIPVCRDAFINITGIAADTIQQARMQVVGGQPLALSQLGAWVASRPLKYMHARSWILNYATEHADSSPLRPTLELPAGPKKLYYAMYHHQCFGKIQEELFASMVVFLKVWRIELPFVTRRSAAGPFSHCGLCDYFQMIINRCEHQALRNALMLRLGKHFDFQGSQRIAVERLFEKSMHDPLEDAVVGWDKMDSQKVIVPRMRALSRTAFLKNAERLVPGLVGVRAPCLGPRMWVYTALEDQKHGANMICSLLIAVLLEFHALHGALPARFTMNADNTPKETKNWIVVFACVWLLIALKGTRLQEFRFVYLMVGHTHNLIDASFAWINKALAGEDALSLEALFAVLERKMKAPPVWRALTDYYDFRELQHDDFPDMGAPTMKGIAAPHDYRLYWARDGSLCVQSKAWVTSGEWSEPVLLCTKERAETLRHHWPDLIQPAWPKGFQTGANSFARKLRLVVGQDAAAEVDQFTALINCENPLFLPSGISLRQKIQTLRQHGPAMADNSGVGAVLEGIDRAAELCFPGSSLTRDSTIWRGGARADVSRYAGDVGFCIEPVNDNMLILYKNTTDMLVLGRPRPCPVRVGRVLRIVREDENQPYAVVEHWCCGN